MKEEIKEILELYINDDIEYYNLVSDLGYDKLLDYIINLQDTFKDREEYCYGLETQLTNLQEENEKVHKELDYADNYNIYLISKIDKAIEYCDREIGNIIANFDYVDTKDLQNVKNILKGDKDE